jgi:hypothetical protein
LVGSHDVIAAWGHAVQKRRCIDVEEVFVRPEYRRRGFGTQIVDSFKKHASEHRLPLHFWVPWGDHTELNAKNLRCWALKNKLRLKPSERRFAAYMAAAGHPVKRLPKLKWVPDKATSPPYVLDDVEPQTHETRDEEFEVSPRPVTTDQVEWSDTLEEMRMELIEKEFREELTLREAKKLEKLQEQFGRYQDSLSPLPFEEEDGE